MFKDHSYVVWYEQLPQSASWLVNRQAALFIMLMPDTSTQHRDYVLLSTFRSSPVLGNPALQQRMRRDL